MGSLHQAFPKPGGSHCQPCEYYLYCKHVIQCITFQPKTLERQLYEEFPDATSTREKVGSKVVVELHLEEGGTTYRGLGYNNRLALIAACRCQKITSKSFQQMGQLFPQLGFLTFSCRCVMAVLEEEESLNQTSNSTEANSENGSTGTTSTNTDPNSSL